MEEWQRLRWISLCGPRGPWPCWRAAAWRSGSWPGRSGGCWRRSRLDPSSASFLLNTGRGALLIAVILIALDQLGVQTTSLIALLGAAGLAVGLALQGSLANFASGLLLLSFRTVRVGDWIEVGGVRGQVRDMHPFYIVLVSEDNRVVTLPNTLLTGGAVANDSALPTRRLRWTLPVSGRDDLASAKEALTARLRADPRVLAEPAPCADVEDWADDRRVLAATAWTSAANRAAVQRDLLEELGKALDAARRTADDSRAPPHS